MTNHWIIALAISMLGVTLAIALLAITVTLGHIDDHLAQLANAHIVMTSI